jgi:hypothetical protein
VTRGRPLRPRRTTTAWHGVLGKGLGHLGPDFGRLAGGPGRDRFLDLAAGCEFAKTGTLQPAACRVG